MTDKTLQKFESIMLAQQTPRAFFDAAEAAHRAGDSEKATRYLRMALNVHNSQLLNQYDLKSQSLGEFNNA